MIIFLLLFNVFSQCNIDIEMATEGKYTVTKTHAKRVFAVVGTFEIDEDIFTQAMVTNEVMYNELTDKVTVLTTIHYDNNIIKYCHKKIGVRFLEDIEKVMKCTCEHSSFYYWTKDRFDEYIEYNATMWRDGYSIPRGGM